MELKTDSRNRIGMPLVGYGTYQLSEAETEHCVAEALTAGFRHIDSAEGYHNEEGTGRAIKASGIPRQELFVTTKLFPGYEPWGAPEKNYEQTIATAKEQLQALQVDYVDLYLIHAPFASLRLEQWQALVELQRQGLAHHIGVSNYNRERLDEITTAGLPLPEVNQIEFHPLCMQRELTRYMCSQKIVPVGYSSLAPLATWRSEEGQGGEVLAEIKTECQRVTAEVAKKLGVTPARLLLRWGMQQGYAVLTKSNKVERIEENIDLFGFSIPDEDLDRLAALDQQQPLAWAANGVDPMAIAAPLAPAVSSAQANNRDLQGE